MKTMDHSPYLCWEIALMRHNVPIELRQLIAEHWPWLSFREKQWLQGCDMRSRLYSRITEVEFTMPGYAFSETFIFMPLDRVVVYKLHPQIRSIEMEFTTNGGGFQQHQEFRFTKMLELCPEEEQHLIYREHRVGADWIIRRDPFCGSDLCRTLVAKMLHSYTQKEAELIIDMLSKRVKTKNIVGRFTLDMSDMSPDGKKRRLHSMF